MARRGAITKLPGNLALAELERVRLLHSLGVRKRSKFGNKKITDPDTGFVFDSLGEYGRWKELKVLEASGHISGLERQVEFPLEVNGLPVGKYFADFVYFDNRLQTRIVEDYKGHKTAVYQIKRKLMQACLGITIYESGPPKRGARHKNTRRRRAK